MLVLSRKIGEVITIGNAINVTILSVDRGVVRVGIEAPKSVPVHRKEIYDKIIEINRAAAATQVDDFINIINTGKVELSLDAEKLSAELDTDIQKKK